MKSKDHKLTLTKVAEVHEKNADLIRSYYSLLEYRKVTGKAVKVSVRCELCKLSVYGNIQKHRTSANHLKLKKFIHPVCGYCQVEFTKRTEYDEHRFSAKHLVAIEKAGKATSDPEYYNLMDVGKILGLDEAKDDHLGFKVRMSDAYEAERLQEAALLTLDKVGKFETPTYDDKQMTGKSLTFLMLGCTCCSSRKASITTNIQGYIKCC